MYKMFWVFPLLLVLIQNSPASAQTAEDLFDPRVLHEIRINIHPKDWQDLKTHFEENTHYAADLHWIFEGKDILVEQVSVRSRGGGSRSGVKPGLTVDFDRFADRTFLGLKRIVLRNNAQDASMLHERLAMTFMSLMAIPTPREAHARLYVNDGYAGLYSIVEPVDEVFLQRIFGQYDGYLYKYEWAFPWYLEYLGLDPAKYSPFPFKAETHANDPDPSPLEQLIRAINETPEPYFQSEVSRYLDLTQFMTYIAIENFLAERDGLIGDWGVNNFYFYRSPDSTMSQLIPWDKSHSFHSWWDLPIFQNIDAYVLSRRGFAIPELRAVYLDTLRRCAELAGGAGGWLEQEVTNEYQQIRAAALQDPLKQCISPHTGLPGNCSNERFEEEVAYLIHFARQRGANVLEQLAAVHE